MFSSLPFQVAYFYSKQMNKKVNGITKEENFDVIYFHLIRSAQHLNYISGSNSLKVLDFTDTVSLYLSRFAAITKNPFKKIALKMELGRSRNSK